MNRGKRVPIDYSDPPYFLLVDQSPFSRGDEAAWAYNARHAPKKRETNLMIGTWVGLRYYLARKYDRATEQGRNT